MPNLRISFRLKMSTWINSWPCVWECDCLSSDPHISPANLKDGKSNLKLQSIISSSTSSSLLFFCQALVSPTLHPLLIVSSTIPKCPMPTYSCQLAFISIFCPSIMSCFYFPFLTSFFSSTKTHLAAIFFSVMKRFSSSSVSSHPPCFLFRKARLISSRAMSENVPLFRHLGDNYEICWTNEHPHSQQCSKSNLIPCRVLQLWIPFDVYGPTFEGTTQLELKLMLDRLSQTFPLLTLILSCHLWSLSQI